MKNIYHTISVVEQLLFSNVTLFIIFGIIYYFSEKTNIAAVTLSFKSEISTVVKDAGGNIVEGHPDEIKKQKDTWVFTKNLSEKSPIWLLKSTL